MTPGDLRALLARYQLRLQELADAVEPVTAVQNAEADPDPGVLFSLRAHRPGDYYIKVSEGSSDDPQPGSADDMRRRLRDLPHGHPSSPYNEDGSRRPPVVRLRDVTCPERKRTDHRPRAAAPSPSRMCRARREKPSD
jgi:hypothetical protein